MTYQTSKNYSALYDLVKAGSEIVSFIYGDPVWVKLVTDPEYVMIYKSPQVVCCENVEEFISECTRLKLEFILPHEKDGCYIGSLTGIGTKKIPKGYWTEVFWENGKWISPQKTEVVAFMSIPEFNETEG